MTRGLEDIDALTRYTLASETAAAQIIATYSTSFGIATRLLGRRHRHHVRNIYALVRIADELVDGVAAEAGLTAGDQRVALDLLESETEQALERGYSSNPIVHAFAGTARTAAIGTDLTRPFFTSMRMDIPSTSTEETGRPGSATAMLRFGGAAHDDYVHGSAEVVGLMCLRVFMRGSDCSEEVTLRLEHGARRLGAAFQNVNFLRDLGDDTERLGRSYLGADEQMTPDLHAGWIATIREQLDDATAVLPLLPADARVAVGCALRLFSNLTERLARTPSSMLHLRRARVPAPVKAWLALRSGIDLWTARTA